jgi:GntR family transcriptional regulator/MocR family aminotransferase
MNLDTVVGMEDPDYPDARYNFALRSGHLVLLAVDEHGLVPSRKLVQFDDVYVTPSHQAPPASPCPCNAATPC